MLNTVRQHNCFITQGNHIGYMFRLLISHLQACFNWFSHKMLCTHWDPSLFTSKVYIKLDHLPQKANDLVVECRPRMSKLANSSSILLAILLWTVGPGSDHVFVLILNVENCNFCYIFL